MKKTTYFLYSALLFLSIQNGYSDDLKLHDLLTKVKSEESNVELKNPTPFINDLQLRLSADFATKEEKSERTNSTDSSRNDSEEGDEKGYGQELTLRFKIDNLDEYRLKKALAKNQKRRKEIISGMSRGGAAKNLIELYISLKLNREKESLLQKLNTIQKDKVKVLKAMSKKGSADVVDYLDAVNKLEASSLDLEMHKVSLQNIVRTINSELSSNYSLSDFSRNERLISIDFIERMLKSRRPVGGLSSKLAKQELERIDILNKLNHESRHKIVDFVDLSFKNGYSTDDSSEDVSNDINSSNSMEQSIGFQIGLNIPFLNSDLKSVGDSLDYIVKKKKAKKEFYEVRDSFEILQMNLLALVEGIKTLRSSKALSEAKKILRVYSRQNGTSPLRLLKLNEFIVSENIKQTEVELELYTKFYQYIYEMDKLSLKNGQLIIKG